VDLAAGTDAAWLERLTRFTVPFDFSGSPTLSLPCGFASDGLPISLQLVARPLEEALLVRAGAVYERATAWHEHHPPVRAG
jgi:Asp-tRNA(Asn)/Glu-tRNA(Gln) amidotransferase A subunit family amidase